MQERKGFIGLALAALLTSFGLAGTCVATDPAGVLRDFQYLSEKGQNPAGGVILDASGNLYGTTNRGGYIEFCPGEGCGTVFELSPKESGGWFETVLYEFGAYDGDGVEPYSGLVFDSHGNLYGTTLFGGTYGFGTVFELSPGVGGSWVESVLYSFSNTGSDGAYPSSTLIFDGVGNLYGTAGGGAYEYGIVFELSLAGAGAWKETTVHSFDPNGTDGTVPSSAPLVFDAAGNLFGTTQQGGTGNGCASGCGTVFELTPGADDVWAETVLYNFTFVGNAGRLPADSGVIFDSAGNLYGTTQGGGTYNYGTVFELSPSGSLWKMKWIHAFGLGDDLGYPSKGVAIDSGGNLYGTTGTFGPPGTVFEMSPLGGGRWSEKVLHSLYAFDISDPSGLVLDSAGNIYGASFYGGSGGEGTVFEVRP
jgi:uncharacterized repeat protein (TIGR03803 family)